jgi:two-component system, OmpR family, sensor histidine kinase VicK
MGLGIYTNRKASVLSYVSMFESLWKQTELYEQVGRLYEQLTVHDKLQEEFINIAAHELRTPIQPILGLAEILRSKKESITITNVYLSVIIRNARRLKELTDNILDIARIECKSMTLNKEVVDIDSVIGDAAGDIIKNEVDPKHDVNLLFDSSKKRGNDIILVEIDKARIRQVISNLISNAFNFTKTGTISITNLMTLSIHSITSKKKIVKYLLNLGDIYIVEKKSYQMLVVIVKPNEISITQYNL